MLSELKKRVQIATERSQTCRFIRRAQERFYLQAANGNWDNIPCEKNSDIAIAAVWGTHPTDVKLVIHGIMACWDCPFYEAG